jgi:hypothetical protein
LVVMSTKWQQYYIKNTQPMKWVAD